MEVLIYTKLWLENSRKEVKLSMLLFPAWGQDFGCPKRLLIQNKYKDFDS